MFYAKLDDGSDTPLRQRPVLTFILDSGMPGLEQSKPFRKMGLHSSPTGELFLTDVRVGQDRLLGETEGTPGGSEGRESAKGNFVTERAGVAAMSLGLIEECLKLSVQYAKDRSAVGAAHRRVPADPVEAGPHGDRPPQRGEPGLPPRRDVREPARASPWPRRRP